MSVRSISALLLLTPVIPLGELQKYVGHHPDAAGEAGFTILIRNQRPRGPDCREGTGIRVPHRYVVSIEMAGRTIYRVERVEVGVELTPDPFTLQPSTESGRGN